MGEEVVIFGNQENSQIKVEELAAKANTIPYEILCGVGKSYLIASKISLALSFPLGL